MKSSLIALILCTLFAVQVPSGSGVLQPSRKGLVALHLPDLTKVEDGVRQQLLTLQNELIATSKNPNTSDAALSEAYGKLAQIYHAYSLITPARECYLNASVLAPKDFRWIYLLGRLDQQEGNFDEAIRRYQLARKFQPDYLALIVNLGNLYLELNRLDEADSSFNAALVLDENNPAIHYGLGQVAMSKRNYVEAVKQFEMTLARVPDATRVHYSLAMAYRGLGETEKARAQLTQQGTVGVRVIDPLVDGLTELIVGERVYLARGKRAFEAQRYADAVVEFRRAVAASPQSVTARINLGAALTQVGDLSGAAEQFEEAIRIEPAKANAHYNLAVILVRQNKHEEAVSHLRSALQVEAGDLVARFLLAQELVKLDRPDEALAEFSQVALADPNNESALLEQVRLLYRKREFKQALDVLERSYGQHPQKGRTAIWLAYILITSPELQLRNSVRALDLAQTIYKATGALQHGVLVAMALAETGRCGEAFKWQQQLIDTAAQQGKTDLLVRLRADQKQYEGPTCRPASDEALTGILFFEKSR